MKICPKCNKEYDDDFIFCQCCGSDLQEKQEVIEQNKVQQKYCPYCRSKIDINSIFCSFCGKSLQQKNTLVQTSKDVANVNKFVKVNKKNSSKLENIQEDETTVFHWAIIVFIFFINLIAEIFAYHFTGMLRIKVAQEQLGYQFTGATTFLLRDMFSFFQVVMLNIVFCLLLYCSWRIVKYYNEKASKIFGLTFVSYLAIIFCFSFGFIAGFLLFLIFMYLVKNYFFKRLVKSK